MSCHSSQFITPHFLLHWRLLDWECHETAYFCTPAKHLCHLSTQVYAERIPIQQDHRKKVPSGHNVLSKFICASQSIWRQLFLMRSLVSRGFRTSNAGSVKQAARRTALAFRTQRLLNSIQSTVDQEY